MEFGKSCCFSGHRLAKLPWKYNERDPRCIEFKDRLFSIIGAEYDSGISHFISGMALGCEIYCAETVIKLKEMHGDITLVSSIPFILHFYNWG